MSDCSNVEVRDLLPDLLHDRLDARTRAQVVAHVDGCADCRAELELLRSMRGALERSTPRVDADRVVAALSSSAAAGHRRRRRVWSDWRVAAAVTFLVAGGTSLAVMRGAPDRGRDSTDTPAVRPAVIVASETTTRADTQAPAGAAVRVPVTHPNRSRPATATPARGGREAVASANDQSAGLGNSRIDDLNARQLKSLLDDIDHMDATPITDPEPVTLRVGARLASPTGL